MLTNPPFGGRKKDGIEQNLPAHFRTRETADLFLALIIRLLKPGLRAAVVLPDVTLFGEGVKKPASRWSDAGYNDDRLPDPAHHVVSLRCNGRQLWEGFAAKLAEERMGGGCAQE